MFGRSAVLISTAVDLELLRLFTQLFIVTLVLEILPLIVVINLKGLKDGSSLSPRSLRKVESQIPEQ